MIGVVWTCTLGVYLAYCNAVGWGAGEWYILMNSANYLRSCSAWGVLLSTWNRDEHDTQVLRNFSIMGGSYFLARRQLP